MLRTCGVVLGEDQVYLAEARLTPVARLHGFLHIADFVTAATCSNPSSPFTIALIDAMTTHETLFFRDPAFWQTIETDVFPRLRQRARTGARVRIWSAACATGQEPYSLAILAAEKFPELLPALEIVASDVSQLAIARAREGVYGNLEVNRGLSAPRLTRHFDQVSAGFRVRDSLRSRITWTAHNLLGSEPDPKACDLVLCRNVLIYFGETDRVAVTRRLLQATIPGGFVGVGSTETLRETPIAAGLYLRAPA
jgi:chemotaxis protein methyltransferase CheR